MTCPTCGAAQPAENKFCEDCGARLAAAPPAPAADRVERVASPALAGVSDRGTTKPRNEDRFAVAQVGGAAVLVVCDGVSCSQSPHLAAEAATTAAIGVLQGDSSGADDGAALGRAVRAADAAVRTVPFVPGDALDPPETTVVAAVCRAGRVTVAWVGDSRAYLVGPAGPRLLTRDHNWQNHAVDAGELSPGRAATDPEARSLTRTLGGRYEADEPSVAEAVVEPGHRLVLCTDGVWDTTPDDLWPSLTAGGDALAIARRLVDRAKSGSTTDNLTAAVLVI